MLLRLRPWRYGPALLLRRPGVALALAAAGFVAALPAAAAPLFLSAAQDATLHHQTARSCPWDSGLAVQSSVIFAPTGAPGDAADRLAERQHEVDAATAGNAGLSTPVTTLISNVNVSGRGKGPLPANLISRTGFRDHVAEREPSADPGLWLPDGLAAEYGLHVGDRVTVTWAPNQFTVRRPSDAQVELPVAGVYTDLRLAADDPYWCSLRPVWQGLPGREDSVLPTVLADPEVFTRLGDGLGNLGATHKIEYAVAEPDRIPIGHAEALAAGVERAQARLRSSPLFGGDQPFASTLHVDTRLPAFVRRAHLVRAGLLPPVVPITTTGTVVGLLVVAAAAVFWVQRRGRELRVLAAHGVSPGGLGLKAVTEASVALIAGTFAGGVCAWLLVGAVGPDARLSTEAVPAAGLATLAALVAAVIVVGVVAALRSRSLTDQRRPARRLRAHHLPWELSLLVAGALAWHWLSDDTQLVDNASDGVGAVAHVPARLLIVPILVIVGVIVFAARLGLAALRRQTRRRAPRRPASLLAWRRLAREATAAAVLTGAIALPMALATFGVSVIRSVRDTTAEQARLVVGSDLTASLSRPARVPPALAGRASVVVRMDHVLAGGILCDVLAVDPRTFGDAVVWDHRIDSPDPADLARQVAGSKVGVATGAAPTGDVRLTWGSRDLGGMTLRHTGLLPGAQGYPVMLVDRDSVDPDMLALGTQQIWVSGDAVSAQKALADAHAPVVRYLTAAGLYAGTLYEPVTFTFTYLIALSVLTGVVTLVGLLLYLESRTGGHRRAYVVLSRMGLSPGSHRRALVGELAVPLAAGLAGGVATAYGVIRLVGKDFDIDPVAPPSALIGLPVATVGWIVAATAAVAVIAGLLTHRRIRRANASEVLRDTV